MVSTMLDATIRNKIIRDGGGTFMLDPKISNLPTHSLTDPHTGLWYVTDAMAKIREENPEGFIVSIASMSSAYSYDDAVSEQKHHFWPRELYIIVTDVDEDGEAFTKTDYGFLPLYLGVWYDNVPGGYWYLDYSVVIPNREDALLMAKNRGEYAIYDIANDKSIPV